ncbi:MAG: hypothetical protein B6I38_07950 [Anaerolineaceae bacterium 4572_5.1]|nr:MAG: hypothetical protein B6I38_07950 [Anaerolineaceae bacterium 4572_5.1]
MSNNTMLETNPEEDFTILIQWADGKSGQRLAAGGGVPEKLKEKSETALNMAMGTMRSMAYRVSKTMNKMDDKIRPDEAEIEFGVNLDMESGAWLAKTSVGAQMTVKLKWNIEQAKRPTIEISK